VVEDRFPSGRPELEAVGVELVGDVAPYELMKLRLLNGAHSALAYLGILAGFETVAEAISHKALSRFIEGLMEDASATLSAPNPAELSVYRHALLARFQNPNVRHRLQQIAMDGSQKLPQRLLGVVRDRLTLNLAIDRHVLALAAWMRFATRIDAFGRVAQISDPLSDQLAAIGKAGGSPTAIVRGFFKLRTVFGDDLPANPRFVTATIDAFSALAGDPLDLTVALQIDR
jgi:fructuronate reductase